MVRDPLLEAVFEAAVDGILIIDANAIIIRLNRAVEKLFGYTSEELLGQNIRMLMASPHRSQHDSYLQRYLQTGQRHIIGIGREVEGRKKDGSLFPFGLSVSEFKMKEELFFAGIIHDLSEQKRAEQEVTQLNRELEARVEERTQQLTDAVNKLLETNQQLKSEIQRRQKAEEALLQSKAAIQHALDSEKEMSELKSRFVSMASHEFRTPLTSILASAELLQVYTHTEQQPKRDKHITRILSSVSNMIGVLNDFLSLSKLESGKVENQPEYFALNTFLEECSQELIGILKKGQHIRVECEQALGEVYLDKRLLKNILLNLLSNAVKYSPENKTIRCYAQLKDHEIQIQVHDEGIGIPKEEQKRLFSRFYRASNSAGIEGTGLGLTIVQRYLDLMGGNIQFVSEVEKGSVFTVTFPA